MMDSGTAMAVAGYLFTYWHTKEAEQRRAIIERVNDQLRELYGPLLSSITATKSNYDAMIDSVTLPPSTSKTRQDIFREAVAEDPHGAVGKAYRHWMEHVLQPLNEQAADVIVRRIDLLQSDEMSKPLLKLVAHVAANRVVIKKWKEGEVEAHSGFPYPDEVHAYITKEFAKMKSKQAELLGVTLPKSKL